MKSAIRLATKKDMKSVYDLIVELAVFEKEPNAVEVTVQNLENDGFGKQPKFTCFVAEADSKIVGTALVYKRYSTWKGEVLHLEDLIVKDSMRGTGLGTALLDEVVKYGNEIGVKRICWEVLDWNAPAITFYEKKGADVKRDWDVVHLNESGIKKLFKQHIVQVFKFGGASVKDANGVKNVLKVLEKVGYKNTLIVVSAMGKTTNALEVVIEKYLNDKTAYKAELENVKNYHQDIMIALFKNEQHAVFKRIDVLFTELLQFFKSNKSPNYNFIYDQVIGYGELVSTTIISYYLNDMHITNTWLDVRQCIKTDDYYRRANVNWETTQTIIANKVEASTLYITQGFIGSDSNNFTTTLGREGSDYTAAIFAYCLNAQSVTIWKDVPGVLNGDPRYFKNTQLLNTISYTEAIELAFYGASVIHPKTLQPLQRKEIPLHVKSFLNPENAGTTVKKTQGIEPKVPCFILKQNQVLLSLSTLDFSYVVEENISEIFNLLALYKMKVDVIQNSAISFSVCFENSYNNLEKLLLHLKAKFKVECHKNVSLYTIRYYNDISIKNLEQDKIVLLKQLFQETVQIVTL